jgi:hypothetical protein
LYLLSKLLSKYELPAEIIFNIADCTLAGTRVGDLGRGTKADMIRGGYSNDYRLQLNSTHLQILIQYISNVSKDKERAKEFLNMTGIKGYLFSNYY